MGPILPSEQANAIGLVVVIVLLGMLFGAILALLTAYLTERRRAAGA
jgi:ABC-type uncharacterized transport system permease subunit